MTELSGLEKKILKEINTDNFTEAEIKLLLKQLRTPELKKYSSVERRYTGPHIKLGIISDLHVGHKNFRYDVFEDSKKVFNKEGVEEILCPGDFIEGMSNREGHIYELEHPGVSNQISAAADLLNQYKQPIIGVLGNHDLWSMRKANQGVDVGKELEARVKNLTIIGHMSSDIKLNKNTTIRLSHEGNSAYALSYSLQKRINSLSGGEKPNVILNGHLHKMIYMFYRNIHAFECGTFEDQTDFMKMKGSPSHVGFMTIDMTYNKNGIVKLTPTFYPYY